MSKPDDPNKDAQRELLEVLNKPTFREEVKEWAQDVLNAANEAYNGDLDDCEYCEGDWEESLDVGFNIYMEPEDLFEEVVKALASPPIVTIEDLADGLRVYLDVNDQRLWGGEGFDDLYAAFLDWVEFRVLARRMSPDLELCLLLGNNDEELADLLKAAEERGRAEILGEPAEVLPRPEAREYEAPFLIWSQNGLSLAITSVRTTASVGGDTLRISRSQYGTLVGRLSGRASERALSGISADVVPAVRAVLRCVSLLGPRSRKEYWARSFSLPAIHRDDLLDYGTFLKTCASLVFPVEGKKDTMARRFSNAVRLLSEADQQTSDAVGLALSVTAMEALLGKKGTDISSSLSDDIAVLLEPEAERRSAASKFVKDLYDSRSRTLHGEQLDLGSSVREEGRTLAAACLYGLWFRNDFRARLGEHVDEPEDLLRELKTLKWVGKVPDCVPEVPPARELWARGQVGC